MSLLTLNKVALIRSKSANAIGVFKRTVAKLAAANAEIVRAQKVREGKISVLTKEVQDLESIKTENKGFIDKINEFLGITSV